MTVTRIRPPARNNKGVIDGAATELELPGAVIAPRSSSDLTEQGRAGTVVGVSLYAIEGTEADRLIRAGGLVRTDLVRHGADVYKIDGEVGIWDSPYGSMANGVEVALTRGEG